MFRLIELFAGIGSQTQALKNLEVKHNVVAISEIDKYALSSYEALHGSPNNFGDIREITELPTADLWTYSFPCQDISLAGKQAGIREGTRSGLLWEVERLLLKAKVSNSLPKFLLLENVKNLVGKKFKADYDKWLAFLSSLGYKTYWEILNAKHYGIPQNRERVFALSVLGDARPYIFPQKQQLRLKLRDMIDTEVDEKYYLSDRALAGILKTNYEQQKRRVENYEICNTLCARDYKDPQCIQVGSLTGEKWDKMHDISRRVYEPSGISPTIHCSAGGNTEPKVLCVNSKVDGRQPSICDRIYDSDGISTAITTSFFPSITEPKIVDDTYKCREPRIYDDIAPSIRSEQHNFKVVAGQFQPVDRDYNKNGTKREEQFECRKDEVANAVLTGDKKNCIKIGALRGRNPDNPSDRTVGVRTEQRLEINQNNTSNTLTTVQKDNLVVEYDEASFIGKGYQRFTDKHGYIPELFNAYNSTEIDGLAPTVTTQCGSSTSSSAILKSDRIYSNAVVTETMRIRKLTPRECLRLMGWKDSQIDKIQNANISNTQQYRQAGNGIVIQVLEAIFKRLFSIYGEI